MNLNNFVKVTSCVNLNYFVKVTSCVNLNYFVKEKSCVNLNYFVKEKSCEFQTILSKLQAIFVSESNFVEQPIYITFLCVENYLFRKNFLWEKYGLIKGVCEVAGTLLTMLSSSW